MDLVYIDHLFIILLMTQQYFAPACAESKSRDALFTYRVDGVYSTCLFLRDQDQLRDSSFLDVHTRTYGPLLYLIHRYFSQQAV